MFLAENIPCFFRRAMESRPRFNVEALMSLSVSPPTAAAGFVAFIELNLQSLRYFSGILELAIRSDHFLEGWAVRYVFHLVRDGAECQRFRQLQTVRISGQMYAGPAIHSD